MFFWLAAETGLRAGELIALRVSDFDVANLSLEVSKAIWNGSEHNPKTEAGFRTVCISTRLGNRLKEHLEGRPEGFLFQTSTGKPWDASNVLERKLNAVLERLGIQKIDPNSLRKLLGKIEPLNRRRGAKSMRHQLVGTPSVTRTPRQWIRSASNSRFASSVSAIAGTV